MIAGLERAVDPNADGSSHDAARVAVVGVSEPYAAFEDSPTARAVAGALTSTPSSSRLPGTTASGATLRQHRRAGGRARALTVGAADDRRSTDSVRVTVRSGYG